MATPGIPQTLTIQQGNGQVYLDWANQSGALSYGVTRSLDGVTFVAVGSVTSNAYLDTTVTVGTNYFYQVASVNASGASAYTGAVSIVPTLTGDESLGSLRLQAQRKADQVNSNFLTKQEWNYNLNQSAFELYDLMVTLFESYYVQTPYQISLTGSDTYPLPADFYKMLGVDCAIQGSNWQTLKKFNFIDRNRYSLPNQVGALARGVNMAYRIVGSNLKLIPAPTTGQTLQLWYIPKMKQLLLDTDILTGVSGWSEYVTTDAAIKAATKEESDPQALMAMKQSLIKRIEESAMNRDVGQPDRVSNTRDVNYGDPFGMY